jgi:hypothetical protein
MELPQAPITPRQSRQPPKGVDAPEAMQTPSDRAAIPTIIGVSEHLARRGFERESEIVRQSRLIGAEPNLRLRIVNAPRGVILSGAQVEVAQTGKWQIFSEHWLVRRCRAPRLAKQLTIALYFANLGPLANGLSRHRRCD